MSPVASIRVFTEFERPQIVLGIEQLRISNSNVSYIVPNGTFGVAYSSNLSRNWVELTSKTYQLSIIKGSQLINITLPIGDAFSPFYLAYYITQQVKIHNLECLFINNTFVIKSGDTNDIVAVVIGIANDASAKLGFQQSGTLIINSQTYNVSSYTQGGVLTTNTYAGVPTISGEYTGVEEDTYYIVVSANDIVTLTQNPSNVYNGIVSVGGHYSSLFNTNYTVTINTENGYECNKGIGYAPTFSVTSTGGDSTPVSKELLFYNCWYEIGNKGLRIKFSDYPFGDGDTFTLDCLAPETSDGVNQTSDEVSTHFIVMTDDGGVSPHRVLSSGNIALPKGLFLHFPVGTFRTGDTFIVKAFGPNFIEIYDLNMGLVGRGGYTPVSGVRIVGKEGMYSFNMAKIGLNSVGVLSDYTYGKTGFKVGILGKVFNKDTNEVLISDASMTEGDVGYFLPYLEVGDYVEVGCSNPAYATDTLYVSLAPSPDEVLSEGHPILGFFYNYI